MLRSKWANILELVQCEIVNVISGDEIDAYMLRYVHVCNNGWIASYISLIHCMVLAASWGEPQAYFLVKVKHCTCIATV